MTFAEKLNFPSDLLKYKSAIKNSHEKQLQKEDNSHGGLIENKARTGADSAVEKQNPPTIQCPTSMALLFLLVLEAVTIAIMESFIIYYHTMIFSQCKFSLETLGLGQTDLIYHGIFIITPAYKLFLYLDALRQRSSCQLLPLVLYGILMVVFTGIQTIQHMTFEKIGCDFPNGNATTTTLPNSALNNTTISTKFKMAVTISNSTTSTNYQDNLDEYVSNIKPFEYAILAFVPICFFIMLGGLAKLHRLYKRNNRLSYTLTDARLRNTLIGWAIYTGLLKIDFFFLFVYVVQLVPSQLANYKNIPAFESLLVFGLSMVSFLIAIFGARNKHVKTLILFSLVLFGSIGYFGYRLFTFSILRDVTDDSFMLTRYNLIFTTLTLALLMVMTLCTSLVCLRNMSYYKTVTNEAHECICSTCFAHFSLGKSNSDSNSTRDNSTCIRESCTRIATVSTYETCCDLETNSVKKIEKCHLKG